MHQHPGCLLHAVIIKLPERSAKPKIVILIKHNSTALISANEKMYFFVNYKHLYLYL